MRAWCGGILMAYGVLFTGALRADEQADAKAIVDKALKAMGPADKLEKLTTAIVKCKVSQDKEGKQFSLAGEGAWDGLDKMRLEGDLVAIGENGRVKLVIQGENGWMSKDGQVRDAPPGMVPMLKQAFYAIRMPHLLPALGDKAFTLAPLGEEKVDDKEAIGITVSHKDHSSVSVLFDKATGLPVKTQTQAADPEGKQITIEFLFSDYRELNGVKHPMRIVLRGDGAEILVELQEIQPKDKLDDSEFAKP